jgi:hypothetical protein
VHTSSGAPTHDPSPAWHPPAQEGEDASAIYLLRSGEVKLMRPCRRPAAATQANTQSPAPPLASPSPDTSASGAPDAAAIGKLPAAAAGKLHDAATAAAAPAPGVVYEQRTVGSPALLGAEALLLDGSDCSGGGGAAFLSTARTKGFAVLWKADGQRLEAVLRLYGDVLRDSLLAYYRQQEAAPGAAWEGVTFAALDDEQGRELRALRRRSASKSGEKALFGEWARRHASGGGGSGPQGAGSNGSALAAAPSQVEMV